MRLLVSLFPQSISSSRFFPTESEKSKGSRSSQIKLHILLSCHLLPRNSPPRSNQNYSKARFKAEGVGGESGFGGRGWWMSFQRHVCTVHSWSCWWEGKQPTATDENKYGGAVIRKVRPLIATTLAWTWTCGGKKTSRCFKSPNTRCSPTRYAVLRGWRMLFGTGRTVKWRVFRVWLGSRSGSSIS